MSTKPSSLEQAIRDEADMGGVLGVAMDAQQLDMLRGEDGKLPDNVFRLARQRSSGRPVGSRNKRNDTLAKLIVQQHGDPVMFEASIYSMPLDQLIELCLVADSTKEREDRLFELVDRCEKRLADLFQSTGQSLTGETAERLANALENVVDAARLLKTKPGDLAIKALTIQLNAARDVAQYVHSKKPIDTNVNITEDFRAIFVGSSPEQIALQRAHDAVNSGMVSRDQIAGMRIIEGEFSVVDDDDDGEEGDQ